MQFLGEWIEEYIESWDQMLVYWQSSQEDDFSQFETGRKGLEALLHGLDCDLYHCQYTAPSHITHLMLDWE